MCAEVAVGERLRVRRMVGRDIAAVAALDRQVFADPWPESAYVQEVYFNPQARYFVLEAVDAPVRGWMSGRRRGAGRVVGFVGMRVEGRRGHISTLAVRPEWRRQGLGEGLLLMAVDQAISDGAQVVTLEVRISNSGAQRLYGKWGFAARSRLVGYYANGEDAYLMEAAVGKAEGYWDRVRERLEGLWGTLDVEVEGDSFSDASPRGEEERRGRSLR
jgi:[ribosomal protein S18]-alanine N-acetyltransferase